VTNFSSVWNNRLTGNYGRTKASAHFRRLAECSSTRQSAISYHGGLPRGEGAALLIGRGGRIRTSGLLVPNQALYQAEPRPEQTLV
jgi:hypothetical protein